MTQHTKHLLVLLGIILLGWLGGGGHAGNTDVLGHICGFASGLAAGLLIGLLARRSIHDPKARS